MADWDANSAQLTKNLTQAVHAVARKAAERGKITTQDLKAWHTTMMQGLSVPNPSFIGAFRGEPGLERIEVAVGPHPGVPSQAVLKEVEDFFDTINRALEVLDQTIPKGARPKTADELNAVFQVCAKAHADWIRIHPFANGNGRTSRLLANYMAMRYGLPPFVMTRPRPGGGYGAAGAAAMQGDWQATIPVIRQMYLDLIQSRSSQAAPLPR